MEWAIGVVDGPFLLTPLSAFQASVFGPSARRLLCVALQAPSSQRPRSATDYRSGRQIQVRGSVELLVLAAFSIGRPSTSVQFSRPAGQTDRLPLKGVIAADSHGRRPVIVSRERERRKVTRVCLSIDLLIDRVDDNVRKDLVVHVHGIAQSESRSFLRHPTIYTRCRLISALCVIVCVLLT